MVKADDSAESDEAEAGGRAKTRQGTKQLRVQNGG